MIVMLAFSAKSRHILAATSTSWAASASCSTSCREPLSTDSTSQKSCATSSSGSRCCGSRLIDRPVRGDRPDAGRAGHGSGMTHDARRSHEIETDVAVIGGGVGGCAAALAAAEAGARVILTEPSDWIGGQLTTQITPPDEHGWIERFGCTASYRRFRDAVRHYYRTHTPLTEAARRDPRLNPGNGWVSPLCHEPRVARTVLESLLEPHVAAGRLQNPDAACARGGRPRPGRHGHGRHATRRRGGRTADGSRAVLPGRHRAGRPPRDRRGRIRDRRRVPRPHGRAQRARHDQPANAQAFSVCCVLDHTEGAVHTIERPAR